MFLMVANVFGQGSKWNWEWARSNPLGGYSGSPSQHLCLDHAGNIYNGFWYNYSILLGDSLFSHDSATYCFAVMKSDPDGNFLQAIEIHGPTWGVQPDITFEVDSYQNLYIAGRFYDSLYIGNNIIRKAKNYPEFLPDVFIVKLDHRFKPEWIRIISCSGWDELGGFAIDRDDNIYLTTAHSRYNKTATWVYYWDQDSLSVPLNGNTSILKIDSDGKLVWKKQILSSINASVSDMKITTGDDNLVYLTGRCYGDIVVEGKLVQIPAAIKPYEGSFFIGISDSGEIKKASFFNFRVCLVNMVVSSNGDPAIIGLPIDPCILGTDTILTPPGKIKYLIARFDSSMNPVWFKTIEMAPFSLQNYYWQHNSLYNKCDTVFFATTFNTFFTIDSTVYNRGRYPQGFFGMIAPDGTLIAQYMTESSLGGSIYNMIPDGCGNVYISGIFKNKTVFGSDTLYSSDSEQEGSRYFAKLRRYIPPYFTLGHDKVINPNSSLIFSLPGNYEHYKWSTGETTSQITLEGSVLGVGCHQIWAEAGEPSCFYTDTITVIVKYSILPPYLINNYAIIYPNPTKGFFNLKTRFKSCKVQIRNNLGILVDPQSAERINEDTVIFDLSSQKPGVYFVSLIEGDQSYTLKLIKY